MSGAKPRIGYLGAGLMGRPMAERLLKAGYAVTVWNRTRAKLDPLVAAGAIDAQTPAGLAGASDLVLMCLMDAAAVEAVVFGDDGIASVSGPATLVDFSSIHPDATRALAARLKAANGMAWIDAPVSGGVPGAEAGSLAIMAGGAADDIEKVRPVVMHLCQRLTRMGDVGAGQTTKLVNQIISGCTMAITAEAVCFAEKAGVDAGRLSEALAGGFADSKPFQIFAPRMAARDFSNPLGTTNSMLKDLRTVLDVGAETGATLPFAATAVDIMERAAANGDGESDISTIVKYFGPAKPAA